MTIIDSISQDESLYQNNFASCRNFGHKNKSANELQIL